MDTLKSVADAINRANEIVRPYFRKVTPSEIFIPDFARFKMKIYYRTGKSSVYWSLDYTTKENGETVRDEWTGLMKLVRLAETKIKANRQIKSIVIWASDEETPDTKAQRYAHQIYCRTVITCKQAQNLKFTRSGSLVLSQIIN